MPKRGRRNAVSEDSQQRLEYSLLLEVLSRFATSRPGKEAVSQLVPLSDLDTITALLAETEEIRVYRKEYGSFRLDDLIDPRPLLDPESPKAQRSLSAEELFDLYRLLDRSFALSQRLQGLDGFPQLEGRGERLEDLPELRGTLQRSVDRGDAVLDSASPLLAELRKQIEREQRELRDWMEKRRQTKEMRGVLQGDVVSIRNDRFVFAVRVEQRHRVRGIVHGESGSGATLFIEPQEIVLRGNTLATSRVQERREVSRILGELTRQVHLLREPICNSFRELVELDTGTARARFGDALGCVAPTVHAERSLVLKSARHPLLLWRERGDSHIAATDIDLESAQSNVVPLDVELGHGYHQLVVTGPNTGGKTVVLKVVGLLALMAYTGIPVPAESATFPLFDAVLADIGDEQSLEQNLSTFSSHMTVTAQILARVSSRSLVLIDELGAGTDPLEGAALGEAILDSLYRRGAFTLVSTHLGRLKEFPFRRKKCRNASMEFDPDALSPTYKLLIGVPGRSNATIIARRIGIPQEVIEQAEQIQRGEDRIDEDVIEGLERTRKDLERRKGEAERHRKSAAQLEKSREEEIEALRSMRSAIEYEAERAEEQRVRNLVAGVRESLKKLGEPPRDRQQHHRQLLQYLEESLLSTRLAQRRQQLASSLGKGDHVFVPRLRAICEITKINKSKQLLSVSLAGIPTEVGFNDISWVLPPPGFELQWYQD